MTIIIKKIEYIFSTIVGWRQFNILSYACLGIKLKTESKYGKPAHLKTCVELSKWCIRM